MVVSVRDRFRRCTFERAAGKLYVVVEPLDGKTAQRVPVGVPARNRLNDKMQGRVIDAVECVPDVQLGHVLGLLRIGLTVFH
jgi:hypothetical protein